MMPDLSHLTVGALRAAIAALSDDAPVFPDWADGPPGDHMPAVCLRRFEVKRQLKGEPEGLALMVKLIPLDEFEDEDEDEDDNDEEEG